jgi:hypothetical protein
MEDCGRRENASNAGGWDSSTINHERRTVRGQSPAASPALLIDAAASEAVGATVSIDDSALDPKALVRI